jgi:SAM-dependent methyltransferase
LKSEFREPYRSRFADLIRAGAGTKDIQDDQSGRYAEQIRAYEALVEREIGRVDVHRKSLCRLIEPLVGQNSRVLDLGCGTGATTVALALSGKINATEVHGLDPNGLSIDAARVRSEGYEDVAGRVRFQVIPPDSPLPFEDGYFDLSVSVSVLEYLRDSAARLRFVQEMVRVTRSGGHIVLITPNPFKLFNYHTGQFLGDWRKVEGFPWASRPWELRRMLAGCDVRFLTGEQLARGLQNRNVPGASLARFLSPLGWLLDWQKVLARKR